MVDFAQQLREVFFLVRRLNTVGLCSKIRKGTTQ